MVLSFNGFFILRFDGYGQQEDKERTQWAGFDGHWVKPINLDELTELLNTLLEPSR